MIPKLSAQAVRIEYEARRGGDDVLAVEEVTLDVMPGERIVLVGPSGCGKSTFMNAVAGLVPIQSGSIAVDGKEVTKPGPDRAVVFQHPSLFPWRTVFGNVIYGLEIQGRDPKEAQARTQELIKLVGLTGFEKAYPHELSGGMQQRVNLARALAVNPDMLLLDEPFAPLDAQTREFMQVELLKILGITGKTMLFVTHQINEAIYLADRVVVMTNSPGRVRDIIQIDIPWPRRLRVKREPKFLEYEDRTWSHIEDEVRKSGKFQIDDPATV